MVFRRPVPLIDEAASLALRATGFVLLEAVEAAFDAVATPVGGVVQTDLRAQSTPRPADRLTRPEPPSGPGRVLMSPYHSGRSRHAASVDSFHKLPFDTCRRSRTGRPVRDGANNDSITAQV